MKKQIEQPISPQNVWASQMGKAQQVHGDGPSQGPAFHKDKEDEWRDGNGY